VISKGPILFKQERNGWNSRVIKVWKFRSMFVHDDAKVTQASRFDPRITPVGRFIRRTSFDELPQLFNVLQGRMPGRSGSESPWIESEMELGVKAWYLVHCKSRQDERAEDNLIRQGYACYRPQVCCERVVKGRRAVVSESLFPGQR